MPRVCTVWYNQRMRILYPVVASDRMPEPRANHRRLSVWLSVCALLGAWAAPATSGLALAQKADEPQIVNSQLGLAGLQLVAPPGRWNWLSVLVRNPSDRDIEAMVAFRTVASQSTGRFNLSKSFHMPARTQRRIAYPVQVVSPAGTPENQARIEIEFVADAQRVDAQSFPVKFAPESFHLVAFAGGRPDTLTSLNGSVLHPRGGPELLARATLYAVPLNDDDLPDDPLGYDQFDTLVLLDPNQRHLRALQWEAIERWIRVGGNLVVVVGEDAPIVDQPDLEALLPVRLTGTRTVTVLPSVAGWSGEPLRTRDPVTLSEAIPSDGETLLSEGANPLVVRRHHGLGTVTYVAVEPADELIGTSAYNRFWIAVFEHLRRPAVLDVPAIEPDVPDLVEDFAGRKIVGVWLPLVVVVGYLGAVLWIMTSSVRSSHFGWMWVWICAASALFAGGGYLAYRVAGPRSADALYEIWLAYGTSPSHTLRIRDYVSLLPSGRGLTALRVGATAARAAPSAEEGATVVSSRDLADASSIEFNAETGRVRTVEVSGAAELPGLQATARSSSGSVELELANHSAFDLTASFVKLGRRLFPVGEVARGRSQVLHIAPAQDTTLLSDYETTTLLDETAPLRRRILDRLLLDPFARGDAEPLSRVPRGSLQGTGSGSFWAGWASASPLDVSWGRDSQTKTADDATRRALGLVALVPRFDVVDEQFLVPKGTMTLEMPDPSSRTYYYGRSVFRGDKTVQGPALTLRFQVPDWAGGAEIREASLFAHFEATDYRLRVYAGDQLLDLPEKPQGRFSLPRGPAFDDGAVELRLEVEYRADAPPQERMRGSRWTIREIDVECLCQRPADPGELPPNQRPAEQDRTP